MSVSSFVKYIFMAALMAFFMTCSSFAAETWQELAKFKVERQEVIFDYNPLEFKIRMKADKGGFFSSEHEKIYSVGSSESLDQALRRIAKFLKREHFSDQLYPQIKSRLSQFRHLTVAECRALHMPLSQPLSKNSLTHLIQEVDKLDQAMRAPAQSVQSIKITEIEFDGEIVDLHLSLDSQGVPTSVGLIKNEGDFSELKLSSEGHSYSLFNSRNEWVLDLILHSQIKAHQDSQKIEIELIRPAVEDSLSESKKEMLILNAEGEKWRSSLGVEGVNDETFEVEIKSVFHEYGIDADSFDHKDLFADWFTGCKVYESQLQISSSERGYFCRELVALQVSYLKGLNKIEGPVAKASFRERYRGCLQKENIMTEDRAEFVLPTDSLQAMTESAQNCHDIAFLPYEQDTYVSSVLEQDVVKRLLVNEKQRMHLADVLHEKAFGFCQEETRGLSSESCRGKVERIKNEYLMTVKISQLLEGISGKQAAGQPVQDRLINKWSECLTQESFEKCVETSFLSIGKAMTSSLDFKLGNGVSDFKIPLTEFGQWRDEFEAGVRHCLEKEIKEVEDFDQLMNGYSFLFEDCREKAELALYPKWYQKELSSKLSRFSESRSPIWERAIHAATEDLGKRVRDGEFAYKAQLEKHLPEILKKDSGKIISYYLDELKKQELVTPKELKRLRKIYTASPNQSEEWSHILSSLFQDRTPKEVDVLMNDFYLNVQKAQMRSIAQSAELSDQDKKMIYDSIGECMGISANQEEQNLGRTALDCRKEILAQEMILAAKKGFEQTVSHHFRLTGERANKILSPVWYMNRCKDDLPRAELSIESYLARVQVCIDLARMDIYELVMNEMIEKNRSLMNEQKKEDPTLAMHSCLLSTFNQISEQTSDTDLKALVTQGTSRKKKGKLSLHDMQSQRFQLSDKRPFLSRLFAENHMERSGPRQDALQIRKYISALDEHPEFRGEWMKQHLNSCLEKTQKMINEALRESFLQHSEHFYNGHVNSQGETDVQVLRHILDDELIELVLKMRDQRGGRQVSSDFTFEALSRAQQVISQKLGEGFVFDRDALKTELIVFRDQLKEGLRWMNLSSQDVSIDALAEFFESSRLANILAYSEISSMVYERFSHFLLKMRDDELSDFEHEVGHRPYSRLTDQEKQVKKKILERYQRLEKLAHEMTSSYDFKRIIHQNDSKGRELLSLLKQHFLLAQITGREVGPRAYERTWELMAELIVEDKTPGGFAERFVAEMAQSHLDQIKQDKWAITKALFYDDEDFDWDELRKTDSGRRALNYYARYLLFPKVMGRELSGYLERLRRSEFERYLSRAQDEY